MLRSPSRTVPCFSRRGRCDSAVPPPSSRNVTTLPEPCSSERKAADPDARDLDHLTAGLRRRHRRARDRSARRRHRPCLPVDARHQLRRRQHGTGGRDATGVRRDQLFGVVLAGAHRRADRGNVLRRGRRARRHSQAVLRAAGDRARGDDRDLRAVARSRQRLPGHQKPGRAVPGADEQGLARRTRPADQRAPALDPRGGADREHRAGVAPQSHPHRQDREGFSGEPGSRTHAGRQPEGRVDGGVGGRRTSRHAHDGVDRGSERFVVRPLASWSEHHGPGTRGRGARGDVVIPPGDARRCRDRCRGVTHPLQLARQAGAHRRPAVPGGARRGRVAESRHRRRRDANVLLHAQGAGDSRAAPRCVVGAPHECVGARPAAGGRRGPAAAGDGAVQASDVHDHPRLRDRRAVAHCADRMGWPNLARTDGVRRHCRAPRRRVDSRATCRSRPLRSAPRPDLLRMVDLDRHCPHRGARGGRRRRRAARPRPSARSEHVRIRSRCAAVPVQPTDSLRRCVLTGVLPAG